MYPQMERFRDAITMTRDDTYHLDLPQQGKLSFILLKVDGTHLAEATSSLTNAKWRIHDYITDIDVVANGQKDIKSLDAYIAQGLSFWDQGVTPPDTWREYSNQWVISWILLNFGEKMWDVNHYLQMEDFQALELRVTNDCPTTVWQDSVHITTYLGWLRGAGVPPSQGFVKSEVYRRYTSVRDAYEYIDLPTGLPIRRIFLQSIPPIGSDGIYSAHPYNVLRDVKFTFRSGAMTVFDAMWWDLIKLNFLERGQEVITGGAIYHNADLGFLVDIGDVRQRAGIASRRGAGAAAATIPTMHGDQNRATQVMEAQESDVVTDFIVRGQAYQHMGVFRFDYLPELQGLLDPSSAGMGICQLELHTRDQASAASGTIRVILERLATPATL